MAASTAWTRDVPRVGQKAERSRTVEPGDIELFTRISGDRNPLHYDAAAAKASRFGEIVVQGGITSAILNAVVAEDLPGPGTVFLQVDWKFIAPVRPGDTITGAVEGVGGRGRGWRCARTSRSPSSRPACGARTEWSSSRARPSATRWRSLPADAPD